MFVVVGITADMMNPIPGHEADFVLTPEDIVMAKKPVGQRVVIYDTTGYVVGAGLAEMLADQGKEVNFVTSHPYIGITLTSSYINVVLVMRVLPKVNFLRDTALLKC